MAASLILHVLIVALLLYGQPRPEQQPDQQEQPVNVAIVPPPEQPKPKPAPVPPKAEKPPPEPPKPKDDQVLKRVFQYGQKDTGPEKSLDGQSAKPDAPPQPPAVPTPPQPNPPANSARQGEPGRPEEKPATAAPDEKPAQREGKQAAEDTDRQPSPPQPADKQAVAPSRPLAAEAGTKPAPPALAAKAKPKPSKTMKFKPASAFKAPSGNAARSSPTNNEDAGSPIYSGLPGVRKLYSQGATGDAFATSSMEKVSRGERVATLCGNVLSRELQNADYSIKWVPTITLDEGNVLNPPLSAFSTRKTWYDLSFRCEVDPDATRVLSFNFRVGSLIPPGEWAQRGFTKYPLD